MQKQVMISSGLMRGAVSFENLHLTLLFLGQLPTAKIAGLDSNLLRISMQPFSVVLDRWGHFSKPGILWLGFSQPVAPLLQLQADVLALCKHYHSGANKMYKPHVTLFRKLNHLPQLGKFEPIEWFVDGLVLVESSTCPEGVKYQVLQEYLFL